MNGISAVEYVKWQIYYSIDPFGEERADYRQGITSSILANVYRKKGAQPARVTDFLVAPQIKPVQSTGQMKAFIKGFADRFKKKGPKNGGD